MLASDVCDQVGQRKTRKRVGRGIGSGHGKTSGRGHKGAGSRSGNTRRTGFEGGQSPIFRRVAKRGQFRGGHSNKQTIVSLSSIVKLIAPGDLVNSEYLFGKGLLKRSDESYKVLADCQTTVAIKLVVRSISRSAAGIVIASGGTVQIEG